ncbi:MAG: hypothetical protein WHS88_12475, partial [Anaerohalosphaeraceae bacterium]
QCQSSCPTGTSCLNGTCNDCDDCVNEIDGLCRMDGKYCIGALMECEIKNPEDGMAINPADPITLKAKATDFDCKYDTDGCSSSVQDPVEVFWFATWLGTSNPAGKFPAGNKGKSVTWYAPKEAGTVMIVAFCRDSESMYIDPIACDAIIVYIVPKIIAIVAGQDLFGLGTQDLWDTLVAEPWANEEGNIVGYFRCDADWDPFDNAEWWIKDQKNLYPLSLVIITGHSNGADAARKVAANLQDDGILVDLLFLFDLVPKPWEFGDPEQKSPKPVSNAVSIFEIYQRDDIRKLGIWPLEVWLQGWYILSGENRPFFTKYKPHGPGPVYYTDPQTMQRTERIRYPHTEMVYDGGPKDDLLCPLITGLGF